MDGTAWGVPLRAMKELSLLTPTIGKKKSRTTVLGHMSVLDLCEGGGRRELVTFSFSDMWRQKGLCQEESSSGPGRGQMPSLVLI